MGSLPAAAQATRFGKYSLVARLATGGMAEIFLARLHGAAGFEKLVCIKRILPHLARDKQFVSMFFDEARIAARISHPNVCQVFELGEIGGSYYIAMEYLEGVPLACFRQLGPEARPDPRLVAGIAIQACEALHHAHQLKNTDGSVMEVVHRDVSPQNLFVTVDGIAKVLDFGIAKIQDATVKTGTGAIKGTYAYMAPEQLRGERVDRRTDVFALGIVMWETLMGRYLFRRDTEFLTFQAITSEPIEDVSVARPEVPPALAAVIGMALERDRDRRFPTARALGEAIAAAIPTLSVPAISDEVARAFPVELGAQAALIRVAREGGAFDLDVERGPSIEPGSGLISGVLTTPTSSRRAFAQLFARSDAGSGAVVVPVDPGPSQSARHSVQMIAAPPPVAATVSSASAMRWRPLVIAALAVAVGGAAAYIYARIGREPAASVTAATPGSNISVAVVAPATPAVEPPHDAAVTTIDAAVAVPTDPVVAAPEPPAHPIRKPPSPPVAPRPSGPPGYITIDSTPVYATIRIDGKDYGETPVVNVALAPGRHRVHAMAPSGATRDVSITIESGKTAPPSRIEW
jgi:serine/threonine-protein kinase